MKKAKLVFTTPKLPYFYQIIILLEGLIHTLHVSYISLFRLSHFNCSGILLVLRTEVPDRGLLNLIYDRDELHLTGIGSPKSFVSFISIPNSTLNLFLLIETNAKDTKTSDLEFKY